METLENVITARPSEVQGLRCVVCDQPTVRLVDGEPSCDTHANRVYEQQWEDYTRQRVYQGNFYR